MKFSKKEVNGKIEESKYRSYMNGDKIMGNISREEAFELLKKYNKDSFHIQHALTVEAVMKWFAKELGYGEEE